MVAASPGTSAAATFGATQAGFRLHEYLRSNTTPLTNIYTGASSASKLPMQQPKLSAHCSWDCCFLFVCTCTCKHMRHGLNTHATSTCLLAEQGQHVEQGRRQVEPSLATTQEKYGKLLSTTCHPPPVRASLSNWRQVQCAGSSDMATVMASALHRGSTPVCDDAKHS